MAAQRLAHIVGKALKQAHHLPLQQRCFGDGRGEDKAAEMLLVREGVVGREHPAPRVAVQVEGVKLQVNAEQLELVDEAVGPPQGRIVRPVGLAAAELVVEDDASSAAGEPLERLQVEASAARTAVEENERPISVTEDPVADGSDIDLEFALLLVHVPPEYGPGRPRSAAPPWTLVRVSGLFVDELPHGLVPIPR